MELTQKQRTVLGLLFSGCGYSVKEILSIANISTSQYYRWFKEPQFKPFQDEYNRLKELQTRTLENIALESAEDLLKQRNPKITEFFLRNAGINPETKVEVKGEVDSNISITIE